MKWLILPLALFISGPGFASNFVFKEAHFTVSGVFKKTDATPHIEKPAFQFEGRVLWTDDADNELPSRAQITVRRTVYECDDVDFSYEQTYSCIINGEKLLRILDEGAKREDGFNSAVSLLKNSFDYSSYNKTFTIPLGGLNQNYESEANSEYRDPTGETEETVEITVKAHGVHPI